MSIIVCSLQRQRSVLTNSAVMNFIITWFDVYASSPNFAVNFVAFVCARALRLALLLAPAVCCFVLSSCGPSD